MNASIPVSKLNQALKIVALAVERKVTIPVLSCLRMEQLPTGVALETTDLDLAIRAVLKDEKGGPKTPLVMPAEHFISWTKLLSGDDVKISSTDKRATLTSGRARAALPVFNVNQWPADTIPELAGDSLTFASDSLKRALSFAAISMSTTESRYVINGILLQGDGNKLQVVSTDGHCMTIYTVASHEKINLFMPAKLIKAVLPLMKDDDSALDLKFDDNRIMATIDDKTGSIYLASRKLAGKFPAWEAVIPSEKRVSIIADVRELLESLERCILLSEKDSGCVKLTFADQITIEASSTLNGEAHETVECEGHSDNPITIGVCGDFLLSLLRKLDGKIAIEIPPNNSSALAFKAEPHEGETLSYIAMPMRF